MRARQQQTLLLASASNDVVTLLKVMTSAKELDVLGNDGGTSLRNGYHMIEMQLVGGSTCYALAAVPLPNLQFDRRWYHPALLGAWDGWSRKVFFAFYGYEFELEHLAPGG